MRPPSGFRRVTLVTAGGAVALVVSVAAPLPLQVSMLSPAAASVAGQWTTYHLDNARTGDDVSEPSLRSPVPAWTSPTLDGAVYAEPVVLGGVVVVVTEGDSFYGLDATTGAVRWRTNVGTPVPRSSLPCGDIDPLGITGTPVIDASTGTVYAAAEVSGPAHVLVAVDVSTGAVKWQHAIDPLGMDPVVQQERAALALAGGRVYVSFGGLLGDCGDYHGWVVSWAADGSGSLAAYEVPTAREGGIWAPSGPAVDAAGNVYVATGNGSSTTTYDHGNSVIKLSPTLSELDHFAPTTWATDNASDSDLGSTGPSLLLNNLVFQVGKQRTAYLLDANHLGGMGGQLFGADVCAAYGGEAYAPPYVYVPCTDGLRAVQLNPSGPSFTVAWHATASATGPPIVAGGLVWSLGISNGILYGLDPTTGATVAQLTVGPVEHFSTPSAANGLLLVAAGTYVKAFAPAPSAPPFTGYVLDGWGGVHPSGSAPAAPDSAYWPGWDIARGIALRPDKASGYVLDGWGGVHSFGAAPARAAGAYYPGWDIARGIALNPCDASGTSGWTLDGWGGLHAFGGAPGVTASAYYPGWDIARGIAVNPCPSSGSPSGEVLDGWGGLHPFWARGTAPVAAPSSSAYYPGWDIARGIAISAAGRGYVLDGWGGVHPFGGAPDETASGYTPGVNLARGLFVRPDGTSGYTLDGWGGIHSFGAAPAASSGFVTPGWDISRAVAG